jgi:transposase InsO family protein
VRQFVSHCDTCQRVKHPNWAFEIVNRPHLPAKAGELLSLDLYGPLPTGCGGVKYLLVCLDIFSKHITIYPPKAATTKTCLNKLTNNYFPEVIKQKVILSDHGSQYTSPPWRKTLSKLRSEVRCSAIRHPESNPAEMAKYFRIYCNETHKSGRNY